jgi:hypothetical protein
MKTIGSLAVCVAFSIAVFAAAGDRITFDGSVLRIPE